MLDTALLVVALATSFAVPRLAPDALEARAANHASSDLPASDAASVVHATALMPDDADDRDADNTDADDRGAIDSAGEKRAVDPAAPVEAKVMVTEAGPVAAPAAADPLTPFGALQARLSGGLLAERQRINREATLDAVWSQCDATGRIANLRRAARLEPGDHRGALYNDSDVYKMVEGAAAILALRPDARSQQRLDALIDTIVQAQGGDGYVNSWYTLVEPDAKWSNLAHGHEMYCLGHLIEAAVTSYEGSGDRRLLGAADRAARLLDQRFGPNGVAAVAGHPEIEIALMRLYGVTGNPRDLALAARFIDERGVHTTREPLGDYCQDHLPLREQREVVGHAVRAMYLFNGATRMAIEKRRQGEPDEALESALRALWEDLVDHKMYVTGGIGSSASNEGFTTAYDLPNDEAYAETCAAIGLAQWAHQMNLLTGDARYADVLEKTLLNAVLAGVSLDGRSFFYSNPLASRDGATRSTWFECACCPPNVLRLLATLGEFVFARSTDTLYVNQYTGSTIDFSHRRDVAAVTMMTDYPASGVVHIEVHAYRPFEFTLALRIPSWCASHRITINGEPVDAPVENGYARITRRWHPHDAVVLTLDMPVRTVTAPPEVTACAGRFALQRGPIVYCVEGHDSAPDLRGLVFPQWQTFEVTQRPDLLGGVTVISGFAERLPGGAGAGEGATAEGDRPTDRVPFTAIPYATWANRGPSPMLVWLPADAAHAEPAQPERGN